MNALEIRGLRRDYPGFSFGPVDLTLPGGCVMGLIGANGAGKSTLIRLVLGARLRDGGQVRVLGREAASMEEVGVVPDTVGLPGTMTAAQVGRMMRGVYRNWEGEVYAALLDRLSLPADKRFRDLSRGMRMKLGLAVALSHRPRLLLLDEATSGLDPVVRDEVLDMICDFTRDESHAVLISSHIVSDLEKVCDYVAFLREGRLLLCREKDALLAEYGLFRGTAEQMNALGRAVLGRRESGWGVEALVRREAVPASAALSPVGLEELFLYINREGRIA